MASEFRLLVIFAFVLLAFSAVSSFAAVKIRPATAPVFAEEPDYKQYPAGISGYTGMDLQQVAYWERKPAMRARIGTRGLYKSTIAQQPDGKVIAACCFADKDVTGGYKIRVFRSADEGKTWAEVTTTGAQLLGKEPSLTCLSDGVLLLVAQVMGKGAGMYHSADGGASWTVVTVELHMYTRNIIEQPDHSLLLFDADSRLVSADRGQSWMLRERIKVKDVPEFKFEEASFVRTGPKRLLATARMYGDEYEKITGDLIKDLPEFKGMPNRDECSDHMVLLESGDGGLTWTKPRKFLKYAEVHAYLSKLRDGRILATYTNYHMPYGSFAVLSKDNGRTWGYNHPIHLSNSLDCYTGWANSVQLEDGTILTCYANKSYLEGANDNAAEVVRWALPGSKTTVEPSPNPVFAELPDFGKYPAGISGFSYDLQEVQYLTMRPAMRARVGGRGLYKGSMVQLKDGSMLANPAADNKSVSHFYRSFDLGRTWKRQGDALAGGGESRLLCLKDGTVLLSHGGGVSHSTDNGVTWTKVEVDKGGGYGNNIVPLSNGDLVIFCSNGDWYFRMREKMPENTKVWRVRSKDGGRTWVREDDVKGWDNPHPMFDENFTFAITDQHLLLSPRVSGDIVIGNETPPRGLPTPDGDEIGDRMLLLDSFDGGKTWSEPRNFLEYGTVHGQMIRLKDGRLLYTYVVYHLPWSVFAITSSDNGKTWDTRHPVQLSHSMDMFTGWPTSIQLSDGSIITSYAASAYQEAQKNGTKHGGTNTVFEVVRWALP